MTAVVFSLVGLLTFALSMGLWIAISLLAVGYGLLWLFMGHLPINLIMAQSIWNMATTPQILALPLFIFMAEILFRTKLSEALFQGLMPWTTGLPGGLFHVNVLACTLFAAVSGSSAATAATVGRITLTDLIARGYDRDLAMGSLAGAGTLGFMIPPSTAMIIYALIANVSVLQMFAAGIVPGLMLAFFFMLYLAVRVLLKPSLVPHGDERFSWKERLRSLGRLGPVLSLITVVLGSMYGGVATPTEAAAMGVFGALVLAIAQRNLKWSNIKEACFSAIRTSSMIGLIVSAAAFLSVGMAYLGVPTSVAKGIGAANLSPFQLIMLLLLFYAILGMILDGVSITVMTLPITLPLVTQAGFDPIWFGVIVILVVEMAQVTPPVGFNLFVIQGLTNESISKVAIAAFPFFLIMAAMVVLLTVFPEIPLVVPHLLGFR